MQPRLPLPLAYCTAFFAGGSVLMLEILGSRLMAPFYGTGLNVWAALISITLVALSVGYWVGGIIADRRQGDPKALAWILIAAALLVAFLPVITTPILSWAYRLAGFEGGVLLSAFLLLIPPLTLLGTVSPYLVRAALGAEDHAGRTVGSLYAVSTLGSVIGALVTAFVLIPRLGVRGGLVVIALCTLVPVVAGLGRRLLSTGAAVVVAVVTLLLTPGSEAVTSADGQWQVVARSESIYGEIRVVDNPQGYERVCVLDGSCQNWVWLDDPSSSLFQYTSVVIDQIGKILPTGGRALVIGLGGGVIPEALAHRGADVEVVEINPQMVEVAERWFDFDPSSVSLHVIDGRIFLNDAPSGVYDVVMLDVAGGGTQPWHLFSAEAFAEMKRVLTDEGVLIINLIGFTQPERNQIMSAVHRTVESVFPTVQAWVVPGRSKDSLTNILFYASQSGIPAAVESAARKHNLRTVSIAGATGQPLTDDHNPIDLWSPEVNLVWRQGMVAWLGEDVLTR